MIISTFAEKVFEKPNIPPYAKSKERVRLEGMCFSITKATYNKTTDKIFLEKKCEAILLNHD